MNELVNGIGKENKLSILNDPFKKSCIEQIWVQLSKSIMGNVYASGSVKFQNGGTMGGQEFKGESFDDVVAKIKLFIQELDNKKSA